MKLHFLKLLLTTILVLNIIACKNGTSRESKALNIEFHEEDILFMGDSLISNEKFIKNIDLTCVISEGGLKITESYKKKCVFYKLNFPYEELNGLDNKIVQNYNGIDYIIKKSNTMSDADDFVIQNLIIKKENIITDSIRVYSYENYIEALVQKNEYYYLSNNNLWILKFNEDEDGVSVVSWDKYEVNNLGRLISLE